MLTLVGLPGDILTNRSGWATLITRMAAKGVPDEIDMLITGHHTIGGYGRYDRTQELKMVVAALVDAVPEVTYEQALTTVSKDFLAEKIVGNVGNLKPLIARVFGNTPTVSITKESEVKSRVEAVVVTARAEKISEWHQSYDGIDWEAATKNDPRLGKSLGGQSSRPISIGSAMSGNWFEHCTINIICNSEKDKENIAPNLS